MVVVVVVIEAFEVVASETFAGADGVRHDHERICQSVSSFVLLPEKIRSRRDCVYGDVLQLYCKCFDSFNL